MNKLNINTGLLILSIAMLFTYACGSTKVQHIKEPYESTGIASYYADSLHGNKTASGERYDKNEINSRPPLAALRHPAIGDQFEKRAKNRGPRQRPRPVSSKGASLTFQGRLQKNSK